MLTVQQVACMLTSYVSRRAINQHQLTFVGLSPSNRNRSPKQPLRQLDSLASRLHFQITPIRVNKPLPSRAAVCHFASLAFEAPNDDKPQHA